MDRRATAKAARAAVQQTCLLYGRDGQPIAAMGCLTEDGEHCEFQGQRFPSATPYPDPSIGACAWTRRRHTASGLYPERTKRPVLEPMSTRLPPSSGCGPGPSGVPPARRLDPAKLQRLLAQGALGPIRGDLDNRCILNEGDHQVSPIGHPLARTANTASSSAT